MSEKYKVRDKDRAHFMTLTVTGWKNVFLESEHIDVIISSLKYCQETKGLNIFAWCLMSNHLHLIARADGSDTLPEIIRDFKKYTGKKIVALMQTKHEYGVGEVDYSKILWTLQSAAKRIKRVKRFKFWKDGFHPIELYSNKFIKQKLMYVHNNPVKAGLVAYPEDYWYSSARNYADMDNLLDVTVIAEALRV